MRPYVEATWGWDNDVQAGFWQRTAHDGVQVVEHEGALIGYMDVQTRDDHVEIVNIVLGPDAQGRGIGSRIIWKVIEDARNGGLDVRLQVLKVNTRAKKLYERLGFTATGETETHVAMIHRPTRT